MLHLPVREAPFFIDERVSICGIVKSDGDLSIEGCYEIDVCCAHLYIQEHAFVSGVLTAEMVEIAGEVTGEVYANLIILLSTAQVEAELYYRAIELDAGCHFEGISRRLADPLSAGPRYDILSSSR